MFKRNGSSRINTITPTSENIVNSAAWFRLEDQLNWYDTKSLSCQSWYKRLKTAQVTLAVIIPAGSLLPPACVALYTSIAGVLIAVLEAVQQMNQYSTLWVTYRATAERLKHEKYLFLSAAGPYKSLSEADSIVMLAERVEEHVSTEHANWFNESKRMNTANKSEQGSK